MQTVEQISRTAQALNALKLPIRLVQTAHDGWVWAVCARGSWKPLMLTRDLGTARDMAVQP